MGAFDPSAAFFVRHGGSFPAWPRGNGMAGRLAGSRREPVFGRLSASGEKWPALTAAGGRACRCDRAGSGEQTRRLTGLLRPTQEQHKSGSRRRPTREQHGRNGIPRHTLARVLKSLCQPNYQDGCALAGLTDQYSPGGIGSDRPSEKRKVGSSTLPLTTIKVFTFDLRLSSRLGLTRTLKGSGIIAMFTLRSRDRRPGPALGDEHNPLPSGSRHAQCGHRKIPGLTCSVVPCSWARPAGAFTSAWAGQGAVSAARSPGWCPAGPGQ